MAAPWQNKPRHAQSCRQSLSGSNSVVLLLSSLFVITSYNEQIHEYTCRKQQQHLPFVPESVP